MAPAYAVLCGVLVLLVTMLAMTTAGTVAGAPGVAAPLRSAPPASLWRLPAAVIRHTPAGAVVRDAPLGLPRELKSPFPLVPAPSSHYADSTGDPTQRSMSP